MKKVGKILSCLLPALICFACQWLTAIAGTVGATTIFSVQGILKGVENDEALWNYVNEKLMNANTLLVITIIATCATLVIGFFWYKNMRPETDLKLKEVVSPGLFLSMFLLGVALQLLVSSCLNVVFPMLPQTMTESYNEVIETLTGGNLWLSLLTTVILAPLAEELIFRGVTLKKAQKLMPFLAANVLQAVLFGLYHGNLIQGIYAFALGLVLGFVAEYFHSIWASILLHAFVNGSAELLNLLPEVMVSTYVGVIALAVAGVVLLLVSVRLFPIAGKARAVIFEESAEQETKFTENSFDE